MLGCTRSLEPLGQRVPELLHARAVLIQGIALQDTIRFHVVSRHPRYLVHPATQFPAILGRLRNGKEFRHLTDAGRLVDQSCFSRGQFHLLLLESAPSRGRLG